MNPLRRIRLEACKLKVADNLEKHANQPQRNAQQIQPTERRWRGHRYQQWSRNETSQHRLETEDDVEAFETKVRFVVFSNGLVSMIFRFAMITHGNEDR